MLDYHSEPLPDVCDVCLYSVEHGLDCGYEHARARVATAFMVDDLEALPNESSRLSAMAVRSTGFAPGPVHPLDPRHWFWAIYYEPRIRLSLREQP